MFHYLFVEKLKWITDSTFTEIFSITQALPGPASTQTAFTIALLRNGLWSSVASFLCWNGPGMVILIGVAVGVSFVPPSLPIWAVMIRSGLSSAAIGLISSAGVKLAFKSLNGGTAGKDYANVMILICYLVTCGSILLYNYSWMPPVLILVGGIIHYGYYKFKVLRSNNNSEAVSQTESGAARIQHQEADRELHVYPLLKSKWTSIICTSVWTLLLVFSLIAVDILHATSVGASFRILAAFYLGGSIIWGGGPVVIPLLYNYVVVPGYVTPEQFLFGLAVVNILPGPNFNFAAYAGGLAFAQVLLPGTDALKVFYVIIGGLLCTYSTFFPGLIIQLAAIPVWTYFRQAKDVMIFFDGVSAAAIALIFGSVFTLWQNLQELEQGTKTLTPELEVSIAVITFGGTYYNYFPLWFIIISVIISIIYYGTTL